MTTLVRWDPFREAAAVHNELSRLMNGLYDGDGRSTQTWVPTLDAWIAEWSALGRGYAILPPELYRTLSANGVPMRELARDSRRVIVSRQ